MFTPQLQGTLGELPLHLDQLLSRSALWKSFWELPSTSFQVFSTPPSLCWTLPFPEFLVFLFLVLVSSNKRKNILDSCKSENACSISPLTVQLETGFQIENTLQNFEFYCVLASGEKLHTIIIVAFLRVDIFFLYLSGHLQNLLPGSNFPVTVPSCRFVFTHNAGTWQAFFFFNFIYL